MPVSRITEFAKDFDLRLAAGPKALYQAALVNTRYDLFTSDDVGNSWIQP